MAEAKTEFRCLRCDHGWEGPYDPKRPVERACPECGSNSARPLKRKAAMAAASKKKAG